MVGKWDCILHHHICTIISFSISPVSGWDGKPRLSGRGNGSREQGISPSCSLLQPTDFWLESWSGVKAPWTPMEPTSHQQGKSKGDEPATAAQPCWQWEEDDSMPVWKQRAFVELPKILWFQEPLEGGEGSISFLSPLKQWPGIKLKLLEFSSFSVGDVITQRL